MAVDPGQPNHDPQSDEVPFRYHATPEITAIPTAIDNLAYATEPLSAETAV